MKNIILAQNAGFCYGVKRAVDTAINTKKKYKSKIYTLGPLIHNNDVVEFLKENQIYPIEIENIDLLNKNDVIIIRSHGIPKSTFDKLNIKGLTVVDATCPYVKNIHKKVEKYHELGYDIIIVGDKNHPEVIGINGWCNNEAIITRDGKDISRIQNKTCVVSQTTEKLENFKIVINNIIDTYNELIIFNTICSATGTRQKSADDLSKKVEAMIVIGGKHSSNTTKLYEICKKNCTLTVHVENANELSENIIYSNKITNIGVTAGASTPDWIIKEAISKMNNENIEMNEQLQFMEENDVKIYVGKIVKGEIISVSEDEAFINIGYKTDALLPINEVTYDENQKLNELFNIGDTIEAKILNVKNVDDYVVLSKKEIDRDNSYIELSDAFTNKEEIKVFVKKAIKGGLLASYKSIRVFIPASQVDLYHVENLENYVGNELNVVILELSKGRRGTKIVASRKELLKAEKEELENQTWDSIKNEDIVEGIVRRITNFGAFVEVNGIDGLLHISEVSWGKINKLDQVLKIGDKIKVYVLDADKENKKLSLSIKKLTEDPWKNVIEKYPVGNTVLGKVVRLVDFGAFVELEPGVDALIHISQISHERINKPGDVLKINESVKAKIIDINQENKKIALSIKALDEI
jgi:small subunit ribosomal protein S1/4-hydroxy-3-methylbut-2-en-1-yl diphosphate reductase